MGQFRRRISLVFNKLQGIKCQSPKILSLTVMIFDTRAAVLKSYNYMCLNHSGIGTIDNLDRSEQVFDQYDTSVCLIYCPKRAADSKKCLRGMKIPNIVSKSFTCPPMILKFFRPEISIVVEISIDFDLLSMRQQGIHALSNIFSPIYALSDPREYPQTLISHLGSGPAF